jgi:hypothetical protein
MSQSLEPVNKLPSTAKKFADMIEVKNLVMREIILNYQSSHSIIT